MPSRPTIAVARRRSTSRGACPYCHATIDQGEAAAACERPGCAAEYHRECWDECVGGYGGCAIMGCRSIRAVDRGPEPSWWRGRVAGLAALAAAAVVVLTPAVLAALASPRGGHLASVVGALGLALAVLPVGAILGLAGLHDLIAPGRRRWSVAIWDVVTGDGVL